MAKKLIRLTESDLHRIVKESVKSALNEVNVFDPRTGEYVSVHGNDQWGWDKMSGIRNYYKKQASDEANRYNTECNDIDDKIDFGRENGMDKTQLDNLRQQRRTAKANYRNMQNIADKHDNAKYRNIQIYGQMGRQELQKLNNRLSSYLNGRQQNQYQHQT